MVKAGVDYVGIGFGVMLLKDNKVLLGKRHEDPEKADSELRGEGTWTFPGGKIKYGETFEEAAAREVKEETSLDIDNMEIIALNQDRNEHAHFITIGFLSTEFSGEVQTMEPEEITEWQWFDLDNLPKNVFFPSEKILANYKQKKIYIP